MPNKETIIRQLKETSVQIGEKMDTLYSEGINEIADELSIAYSNLLKIVNIEDKDIIPDNDFLAATMLWTACNTILAGLDLFRRGYSKEHLMLLRNSLEIMSSAYLIHSDIEKYNLLINTPDKFNSTNSISYAKKIIPLIGPMFGIISNGFTHVSAFHMMPHSSDNPFCIGGLFDQNNQKEGPLVLSMIITASEFVNSFIEIIFNRFIDNKRFWEQSDDNFLRYNPIKIIKDRQKKMMDVIGSSLNNM